MTDLLAALQRSLDRAREDRKARDAATAEPEPLTCPLCDSPAYICDAEHVDGNSYLHCRRFAVHSFPASYADDPKDS